jgi:hypothetical protein
MPKPQKPMLPILRFALPEPNAARLEMWRLTPKSSGSINSKLYLGASSLERVQDGISWAKEIIQNPETD